jgi:hypothetical protein
VPLTSNPNCDADKAGDAMAMKMNRASIMQSVRGTVQAIIFRADFYFEVQPPPPPPPLRQVLRIRDKQVKSTRLLEPDIGTAGPVSTWTM